MPGRTVIQWNKDDLDELGILKVDCLCLGMLSAIRRAFELVERHHGRRLTLASIPEGDRGVYAMIGRADTMGVFQIESRAQMSMLPRLRPRCFYDLVIEVAIVRPGPIQGNMVHPYLRRRRGEEAATYPNEAVRGVLEKTLGVPLFQEQAMRLAVVAAGFTPGEADQLRRAMGAWRRPGLIDDFRRKLIDGMKANGFPTEYAEATFNQIRGFGDYGFPESHAASFALLVYVSAWLKHHYLAAFTAALLDSQPMGFYAPAQLVRNAREHGVEVRPVDVNYSRWESTLEDCKGTGSVATLDAASAKEVMATVPVPFAGGPKEGDRHRGDESCPHPKPTCATEPVPPTPPGFALRLGLQMLHGLQSQHAERIVAARGDRPFDDLDDFCRRTRLGRAAVARLAKAGAFGSLELSRRTALWHALAESPEELPLFDHSSRHTPCAVAGDTTGNAATEAADGTRSVPATMDVPLPPMSPAQEVLADYRTTGLSLTNHPMSFLRPGLEKIGVVSARQLAVIRRGAPVRVAGIVLVRQRPGTAKGITFVTLEDETGTSNLIIRPDVWGRWREAALGATILLATGRLQREGRVIHVLTWKLEDLSPRLADLGAQSRDFC